MTDVAEKALQNEVKKSGTVNQFTAAILKQCNVAWNPYYKSNEKKSETNLEFPSLGGGDKTKILDNLRDFSTFVIHDDEIVENTNNNSKDSSKSDDKSSDVTTAGSINTSDESTTPVEPVLKKIPQTATVKCKSWKEIFENLSEIFKYLNCNHVQKNKKGGIKNCKDIHPAIMNIKDYCKAISTLKKLWIETIGPESIKNYFHGLEKHVPEMIESNHNPFKGTIAVFSCSAQELKNRTQTIIHFRNTNQKKVSETIIKFELARIWLKVNKSSFFGKSQGKRAKKNSSRLKDMEEYFFGVSRPPDEEVPINIEIDDDDDESSSDEFIIPDSPQSIAEFLRNVETN